MLIGHYGAAYALRAHDRRVPLWAYFLLVQAVDIVFFVFAVLGVEELEILHHDGPLALGLVSVPYTHSLVLNLLYGIVLVMAGVALRRSRIGLLVSLAVVSHWATDLVVHVHDLPITPAERHRLGFALWEYPLLGLLIELAVLSAGGWYLLRSVTHERGRRVVSTSLIVLAVIQIVYVIIPPFRPVWLMALMAESIYVGAALLAVWVERTIDVPAA